MFEKPDQAFLILCHRLNPATVALYHKIREASPPFGPTWLLFHSRSGFYPPGLRQYQNYRCSNMTLQALSCGPVGPSLVPGNCHLPLFQFFQAFPHFDYYWLIEYDVRFSGDWRNFFELLTSIQADFVTNHVTCYADEPTWLWWKSLQHPHQSIPLPDRLKSFNPMVRLSQAALRFLFDAVRDGWRGHNEVLLPTLLRRNGFTVANFGGNSQLTPAPVRNKFHTATIRHRPPFWRSGSRADTFYHPVKPLFWVILWHLKVNLRRAYQAAKSCFPRVQPKPRRNFSPTPD